MVTALALHHDQKRQHGVAAFDRTAPALTVSIIIPAYNEASAIERCLLAAVTQTVVPWEILVVDNRSTDRTTQIVQRVAANYPLAPIKLINQSEIQGLVPTRDLGFAMATGDVLGRIDADTVIASDWVENVIEGMCDPMVAAITGPVTYYDVPLVRGSGFSDDFARRTLRRLGGAYPFLYGSNMAIRADAWRAIRQDVCLDVEDLFHEDIDLSIHLHDAGLDVAYSSSMRGAVSARRLSSSSASFREYTGRFHRTYAHHGVDHWHLRVPELLLQSIYWPARLMRSFERTHGAVTA
ncbi:glycosyltransferase family 2 protein [Glaciihabitans sp. dw_435]|uniref:glycosyltransferase family 2 protein n=1 Tax=Glaciihabitans sp. dw_435 TaxID=2720081 RepID=UPI001BD53C9A|nr:glycosyltransferase family 2 protein [Glaciihabitans sp. dw_435]